MKTMYLRLFALLLCLLLTACSDAAPAPTLTATPVAESTAEPAPTPEPAPEPTPEPDPTPTPFAAYTLPLQASVPIYNGPGTACGYARDVGQDGVYTIVEEVSGEDGSLWGRLKSGAGWVNLESPSEEEDIPPFTADYAFPELLQSGDFARCIADDGEYSIGLMILPHETLRDVSFEMLVWGENGFAVDCVYDTFPELSAARPLVADVVFYGDMTTYGISFTDVYGALRHFAISMSGKDGSLIATEY